MARGPTPRRGWEGKEEDDAKDAWRCEERGREKKKKGREGREARKGQITVDACLAMATDVESWACGMGMEERS